MNRRELMLGMGGLGLAGLAAPASAQGQDFKAIAREAWLYGLPLIEMETTRARHFKSGAKPNVFAGGRALADHTSRNVTTPNNDTLYRSAWVDLSGGPVTLTVPALGDRYWSVAVMDMYTNNNAVLGSRTVGGQGGTFMLAAPDQAAPILDDRTEPYVVRTATSLVWVLVRVLIDGPEDMAAVQGILAQFTLAGGKPGPAAPLPVARDADPGAYFGNVRALMAAYPPPVTDLKIIRRSAGLLGGAPPQTAAKAVQAHAAAIEAGVAEAREFARGGWARQAPIQGWTYPPASLGDFGQDYPFRAAIALGGLAALPRVEAMYLRPAAEQDGLFLSDRTWRLSLPAEVPVDAFWSLSMYEATSDGQLFFTDNPLKRYALGDRTKGLRRRADGGVDIWIGRTDPGGDRTSNWLPAPKTGPYAVTWRGYLPRPALLNGQWRMPPIEAG
ncbi:MAG TPA: DUF1254 domain-containing protein [Caulobacter sp.]|nr:DUF1254 domain-containing protein [Caulobacter sp.]